MDAAFRAARGGRVKVRLGAADRGVLAGLLDAVADLLVPGSGDEQDQTPDAASSGTTRAAEPPEGEIFARLEAELAAPPPEDPAVARLLPDGSREDPALAESYRRLTEHDLRQSKRSGLALASSALRRRDPVVLDDSEAQALLKGLTDVRLVLAERLGIRSDEDAELLHAALAMAHETGDDEWSKAAGLYEAVTFVQEELVHTLLPRR